MSISKIHESDLENITKIMGVNLVATEGGGEWVQHFYGINGFGTGSTDPASDCTAWDGVKIIQYPSLNLGAFMPVSGTWAVGYRPTHVRLTYTGLSEAEGDAIEFALVDTNSNAPVDELNYVSGTSVEIAWDSYDIDSIQLVAGGMGTSHTWALSNTTTSGDPGSGYFICNKADEESIDKIYISDTTAYAESVAAFIEDLINHETYLMVLPSNYGSQNCAEWNYILFTIDSITDEGGYHTISVNYVDHSGEIAAETNCEIMMIRQLAITNIEFFI